jgi:hypothetical protein
MRAITLLIGILVSLFMATACATAPVSIPDKYNLDNQLENIQNISKYNMMSWDSVDRQSFVLQTNPGDYYLIVLSSPSEKLPFSESVQITNTGDMVRPGYNNVIVSSPGFEGSYVINKIYKFKDYEQVKAITSQLTGEKN